MLENSFTHSSLKACTVVVLFQSSKTHPHLLEHLLIPVSYVVQYIVLCTISAQGGGVSMKFHFFTDWLNAVSIILSVQYHQSIQYNFRDEDSLFLRYSIRSSSSFFFQQYHPSSKRQEPFHLVQRDGLHPTTSCTFPFHLQ